MEIRRYRNRGIRKVCGCGRWKWKHCKDPWHFSFQWKGTHHRYSLTKLASKPITSKGDAETEAERIRILIKDAKFRLPGEVETPTRETLTVRQLLELYQDRVVKARGDDAVKAHGYAIAAICRTLVPTLAGTPIALGDWKIADMTTDAIEQFRDMRKASGTTGTNRNLGTLQVQTRMADRSFKGTRPQGRPTSTGRTCRQNLAPSCGGSICTFMT